MRPIRLFGFHRRPSRFERRATRAPGADRATLAGLARGYHGLPARRISFTPNGLIPADSYCH